MSDTTILTPGVYIEEFTPGQPIAGVATNIAAFVGIASMGPIGVPTLVTSWDRFRQVFGDAPVEDTYLWYAVRGFYQNGGKIAFIVRVDGSLPDALALRNRGTVASWDVSARTVGSQAPPITVEVVTQNRIAPGAPTQSMAYKPSGTLSAATPFAPPPAVPPPGARDFRLQNAKEAAKFRPGDRISVNGEILTIARVTADKLTVTTDPTSAHALNAPVILARTQAGDRILRITTMSADVAKVLVPGAILTLRQAGSTDTGVVAGVLTEFLDPTTAPPIVSYRVTFRDGLTSSYDLDPAQPSVDVTSEEFDITVGQTGTPKTYAFLSLDAAHSRYFLSEVNDDPNGLVTISWKQPRPVTALPGRLPAAIVATALTGGGTQPPDVNNFTAAVDALKRVDQVNLLACPDAVTFARDPGDGVGATTLRTIQLAMISHCESMGDRFAVLDSRPEARLSGAGSVDEQRTPLESKRGYAALYYPWLITSSVIPSQTLAVPPSGHICGVIARSDSTRGVFKAPANEPVRETLGVAQEMTDDEQGLLNDNGIDCIRSFAGGIPTLWGARTTSRDTNWRYVSTRRLLLYLEESIQEGIRWGVFEPNNQTLWRKLRRSITDFLLRAYRDGAFFGDKPEDAFYVRIDEVLNPFSEQQLGRLTIEIGVRPAFPAEFIIVRIGIWAGGSETTES